MPHAETEIKKLFPLKANIKMKTLILEIKNGGLGDHLFWSHIPRIAKETRTYEKVLLSNQSNFRNKNYKKLIWELNPFVDGFTDEPGISIGDIFPVEGTNLLDMVMLAVGLDDGIRYHEPEIYYQPKNIEFLNEATVYDPNYISNAGFVTGPKVARYFKKNTIHVTHQMIVREKHALPILDFESFLASPDFWDFIDVVYSAKTVYCLVTGTPTLAAALKKKVCVFYTKDQHPMFRHSKLHTYIELP